MTILLLQIAGTSFIVLILARILNALLREGSHPFIYETPFVLACTCGAAFLVTVVAGAFGLLGLVWSGF